MGSRDWLRSDWVSATLVSKTRIQPLSKITVLPCDPLVAIFHLVKSQTIEQLLQGRRSPSANAMILLEGCIVRHTIIVVVVYISNMLSTASASRYAFVNLPRRRKIGVESAVTRSV